MLGKAVLDDQVQEVIVQGRRDEHWTLFKHKFRPTREAFAAYEAHTKRKMTGNELEEVRHRILLRNKVV